MLPPEQTLPLFMERFEALLDLLDSHELVYWFDWGTLLGYHRHRNVIPWDYDVDLCLLEEDFVALRNLFARQGNRLGDLVLDPDYYGEPNSAVFLPLQEDPERFHGFDLVAYARRGGRLECLMSPALVADYPADYHFAEAQVFPLGRGHFLGRRVLTMHRGEERLEYYGDWRAVPAEHAGSPLLARPFREPEPRRRRGDTGLLASLPPRTGRPFARASELRAGGDFYKHTPGVETLWVVTPTELEALRVWGVSEEKLASASFTELVFLAERLLWGRLWVHSLAQGEALYVPPGSFVRSRTSRSVRFERRQDVEPLALGLGR